MTGESQNIQKIEPFEASDQLFTGNGQGLPITSTGSSSFISPFNTNISLSLKHLLHVPNITKNLTSVSQFATDNGVFFEFHSNYCDAKSQVTNEVLLQGKVGPDGLCSFSNIQFQSPVSASSGFACISSSDKSSATSCISSTKSNVNPCNRITFLWHERLGQSNHHVLQLVLQHCKIPTSHKNVIDFCSASLLF